MNVKTAAVLFCAAACGGTSAVTQTSGGDAGSPPEAVAPKAGTYKATAAGTSRAMTAVGPAMATTLITDWGGSFYMVLPGYDIVKGAMRVTPDGTLSLGTGNVLAHADGKVEPAVIIGTSAGNTIAATVNGQPFSVALTDLQEQAFTIAQISGRYVSISSSSGTWSVISLVPDCCSAGLRIEGLVYASQADAQKVLAAPQAVDCAHPSLWQDSSHSIEAVGCYYGGTIGHIDAPADAAPGVVSPPNARSIGFAYLEFASGTHFPATSGFGYFTTDGLVALTVNTLTGAQFTATFSR